MIYPKNQILITYDDFDRRRVAQVFSDYTQQSFLYLDKQKIQLIKIQNLSLAYAMNTKK